MSRITYLDFVGKKYPMSFSLGAAKKIAGKYGGIEKVAEKLGDGASEEAFEMITFLLELLISQGCAYMNYFEKDTPSYEGAPVDESGRFVPLTKEALEIGIDIMSDGNEIVNVILMTMSGSQKKEVNVKPIENEEKNDEATQDIQA